MHSAQSKVTWAVIKLRSRLVIAFTGAGPVIPELEIYLVTKQDLELAYNPTSRS